MKLWQKLSLICIIVMSIIVGICSTLLLTQSRGVILKLTVEQTQKEQKNLQISFSGMAEYHGDERNSSVAKRSLLLYCFKQFAEDLSVLIYADDTLYSNLDFSPAQLLPLTTFDEQSVYMGKIQGRDILIVGSKSLVLSEPCSVYTLRDISSVSNSITDMILYFALVSVVCIAMGIAIIILLVRCTMNPLKKLSYSAGRISKGYYNERAEVLSKDEVGELSEDFNTMAQAVETKIGELTESSERQQMFIGALTHEFKTPLASVIGHSETLLTTNMPTEITANSLMHIHDQCKWLERLTQKLLKLITLQEDIELKQENVSELLNSVKESLDEALQKKGLNLEIVCEIQWLYVDIDLMQSLLVNLVDNAVKASSENGRIYVHAYDNIIEVKDEGVGIDRSQLPRITEPFYRVDKSRSKRQGGAGLGLSIVKNIADAHGAKLSIESVPDIGTTVRLEFNYKTFTS